MSKDKRYVYRQEIDEPKRIVEKFKLVYNCSSKEIHKKINLSSRVTICRTDKCELYCFNSVYKDKRYLYYKKYDEITDSHGQKRLIEHNPIYYESI